MSDPSHDDLLAELGEAMRARAAVPDRFVDAGKAAFTWRTVDAELAALSHDSADPADPAAALAVTRSEPAALRTLTFVASELTIELELTDDALLGQLVPPQGGSVELRPVAGEPVPVEADDVGWFTVRPVPSGLFQLRVRTADGVSVLTEWARF